ncbi:ALS2 C-terminal-like protein isoform X6 [Mirounga angustirostris]|uniref:ALS2 C-terminal-like protein isoform X6 n=1 Tax=Mirounga angustirostris TaxID=9716 RepID=UPI00313B45C5
MCSLEEEALLRLEEVFSATLARVNSLVLLPLLETTPEPSDPQGRECLRLLQRLHRSSQRLWEVTEESLHSLRERLCHQDTVGLESLLLLQHAERILQVHVEYIESYTSCVVVQAFQKAAKKRREFWRGQRKALWQLLPGVSSEASVGTALAQALREPLAHHVQQYVLLLLSLGDTAAELHRTRELVVHAATLFGNLQSFLRQALDQALATQALWHSLSSRLRDVLCTPARRLLQDSQDVPVTVAPLRAERVLLFDDALVLLQGHSVHTFDLKLVWVDPGQDGCTFHLLTPEEELSFCSKAPQDRVVWQWKVTQAVCQALRGKKDFPVLEADLEPSEPPTCRCMAYTFRAEGRLCQATYEGEWCRGRPHGRGTLKWPDGRNHVGNFCQGLEHGFGIRLVPQGPEDRFDCYKCHWREGRMCGYGICEYGTDEVYKGYFQAGLRHGFGVLASAPRAPQPCKYTGHWERGQRSGYGVEEDSARGERYIGMWQADQRHGPGVMVTQAGVCYQGTFQADKMVGPGILLSEDDSLYEGTFTRDLTLVGKALSNSLHPLGKLLRMLMLTFQATYAGIGANKHLQALAQEEVKQHARELWAAYRGLLQVALQRKGQAPEEDEDTETRDLQVHGLVLPLMLPSFYSELFTLYLLLHETEDSLYSQGIANLSLFPDTKLLEFLDVQKHLWPLKDLTLTTNQRLSLVRNKCFLSATECLQKIITTVDPREKLEVLERTYGEIEATVSRVLGREHKLPMDDLLPLLIYVVSRARIQHLGAEIHLIRDMMDPIHTGGLCDFLLTALESCYEHIQKEDMRLHRFAGRWDSREPW